MAKLIGFSNFTSKKGRDLTIALVQTDCTVRDNDRGSYGSKVEQVFLPDELVGSLDVKDIGKNVDVIRDIVGNRAYVIDFKVLK